MNDDLSPTSRLEAFSDGVFAIAITLLIIEIKVPHDVEVEGAGGLLAALGHLWPSYVGYVISFLTIGIMWINHHAMFEYIRQADRRLMLVHVFFLMAVSFLPFPTAVLAEHLTNVHSRTPAAVFYGASLFLTAIAFNAVWWAGIAGRRLLRHDLHETGLHTITSRYRMGPPGYLLATMLALANVWISLALHALLALLFARSERTVNRRHSQSGGGKT